MLTNFIRRFKENDKTLKQEVIRVSGDATRRTTNWYAVVFWALVIAGGIFLYLSVGHK